MAEMAETTEMAAMAREVCAVRLAVGGQRLWIEFTKGEDHPALRSSAQRHACEALRSRTEQLWTAATSLGYL